MNTLAGGLRGGDIGGIMDPVQGTDPYFLLQLVYQFSYYIIVITVLLNVIFGIIIDTFSELRTDRAKKKHLMENT